MKGNNKTQNLDLYNSRHHVVHSTKFQTNHNISDDICIDNTSIANGNSVKQNESIGSSYLVTGKNIKSNSILQKIKLENDKIRKKYFEFHKNKNSNTDNNDIEYFYKSTIDVNDTKNILHPKKRKKCFK